MIGREAIRQRAECQTNTYPVRNAFVFKSARNALGLPTKPNAVLNVCGKFRTSGCKGNRICDKVLTTPLAGRSKKNEVTYI